MMERQAQRMQAAESIQRSACATGPSQECSETANSWSSEQNLYRSLQQRYQQCRMQTGHSFPLRSSAGPNGAGARLGVKRSTLQLRMQKLGIRLSRTAVDERKAAAR